MTIGIKRSNTGYPKYTSVAEMQTIDLKSGDTVEVIAANSGWVGAGNKPKGRAVYNVVTLAEYTIITSLLAADGVNDWLLSNGNVAMLDTAAVVYPFITGEVGVTDYRYNYGDVRRYGVTLDWNGTAGTDDAPMWQNCLNSFKLIGYPIFVPPGQSLILSTITFDTTGDGFAQGLILEGSGSESSTIINAIVAGGPAILLTSGASASDFQFNGSIKNIGFNHFSSGVNSHGIEYRGCWRQKFQSLLFFELNGAGIKATNSSADADSSTNVDMDEIYARDCAGAGFDSTGSTGGLAIHSISNHQFENCNGSNGNMVLDGVISFTSSNMSITAAPAGSRYVATQTGIVIKGTSITPQGIVVEGGEMGNYLQRAILIEKGLNIRIGGFRIVKRVGENTMLTGIEFADGASVISNVTIDPILINFDDATPVTTIFKIGTGIDGFIDIKPAQLTSFAAGNVYISFNAGAENKRINVAAANGQMKFKVGEERKRLSVGAGTITPDLLTGNWQQFLLNSTGNYTINPPSNGAYDGAEFTLGFWNIAGGALGTITFASGINKQGFVKPGDGLYTETVYHYDSSSTVWRPKGAWSTPG